MMNGSPDMRAGPALETRPRRSAIVLSALVFPGAGQILQRRWLAGVAFSVLFTCPFMVSILSFLQIILAFYRMGFEFERYDPGRLPVARAVIAFFISLMVYAVNVADAHAAYRRAAGERARRRLPG